MRPNKADSTRNILVRPQAIKPKEALSYSVESNKAERSAQLLGGEFLDEPSGKAERWYE